MGSVWSEHMVKDTHPFAHFEIDSTFNRPFPSFLLPLFQNESKCEIFHMKMSSACSFIFMQIKVIFIIMFSHLSGLHTANLNWQTRVGKPKLVCVNGTKTGGKHVCKLLASDRNVFADCFCAVNTHQLEFAITSLPTYVCRVKAAL